MRFFFALLAAILLLAASSTGGYVRVVSLIAFYGLLVASASYLYERSLRRTA